jgi:hypothetical protein
MFQGDPKARADLRFGTLYAIAGESDWIYYGQIARNKAVGFFRRRDREIAAADEIVSSPVMAVVFVANASIGRALRAGHWKKLGNFPLHDQLNLGRTTVQWSVGTLDVTVWSSDGSRCTTRVDDPSIQKMEIMATWDAEYHIPRRLTADFGAEEGEWHVGGPIWRERRIREEYARRFPDAPWHSLPPDWVPTSIR